MLQQPDVVLLLRFKIFFLLVHQGSLLLDEVMPLRVQGPFDEHAHLQELLGKHFLDLVDGHIPSRTRANLNLLDEVISQLLLQVLRGNLHIGDLFLLLGIDLPQCFIFLQ